MRKIFANHNYEILILIISFLLYFRLKEFPYFNVLISTEAFLLFFWIEIVVFFKITGEKTILVSLCLFICTIIFAVLGLSLASMMSIVAVSLFIFGSLQLLWEMLMDKRRER